MSEAYDTLADFTTTDWTFFGVGIALLVLGIFVAGRKNEDGPLGLMLWSGTNFSTFCLSAGLGILGMWLSTRLDEGMLVEFLGDGSTDWANTIGLFTGLCLTLAVLVGSMLDKRAPVPSWTGGAIALVGFTILFASGLTITVQEFYNADFTPGWDWIPLFPMNAFFASIWTTALLGLATASLNGIITAQRQVFDDLV